MTHPATPEEIAREMYEALKAYVLDESTAGWLKSRNHKNAIAAIAHYESSITVPMEDEK